jgi:hypothetical protein
LRLGDPHGAASQAERSLGLVDPSFVRQHAGITLYLSSAFTQIREIDQAASALTNVAELAARNRSPRLTDRLLESRAGLRRWDTSQSCPGVGRAAAVLRLRLIRVRKRADDAMLVS